MARRDQIILPNVRAIESDPLYRLGFCRQWRAPDDAPPAVLELPAGQVAWFLTLEGTARFERGGHRYLLDPGAVLLAEDTQHDRFQLAPGAAGRWLQINLSGALAARYCRHLRNRFGFLHKISLRSAPVRTAFGLAALSARAKEDTFAISQEVYTWLNRLDAYLEINHLPVQRLLEMAPEDLLQSPLLAHTVENFARDLGLSRATLSQRLTEQWGEPPGRVLRRLRLQKARQLLEATELTVEDIAGKVGFSGGRALILAFKRQYGTTPGALRPRP